MRSVEIEDDGAQGYWVKYLWAGELRMMERCLDLAGRLERIAGWVKFGVL